MMASCSSVDFSAKLREEHIKTTRSPPSFKMTVSSRTASIDKNCCADAPAGIKKIKAKGQKIKVLLRNKGYYIFFREVITIFPRIFPISSTSFNNAPPPSEDLIFVEAFCSNLNQ